MTDITSAAIEHSVLVRAAPEKVYEALTTAAGLDSWFTDGSQVDRHPGGSIYFRWLDWGPDKITAEDQGLVLEAAPPKRFVFQWHPDTPDYATTVRIDFNPVPEGTVVRLREDGYQNSRDSLRAMLNCAAGWGEALTLMKFFVEHGIRY